MCFDHDSRPPIPPIAGGALDAQTIELEAADGNRFQAYLARAAEPSGAGIVIFPDVRGLHAYYEDLALRFAENGIDAIAIDYFGRTAGIGDRGPGFPYQEHVPLLSSTACAPTRTPPSTTSGRRPGSSACSPSASAWADVSPSSARPSAKAWPASSASTAGRWARTYQHAGPGGPRGELREPGARDLRRGRRGDPPVRGDHVRSSLAAAGVRHEVTTYPKAPHGFFDKKADEFSTTSAKAWDQVLGFIRAGAAA